MNATEKLVNLLTPFFLLAGPLAAQRAASLDARVVHDHSGGMQIAVEGVEDARWFGLLVATAGDELTFAGHTVLANAIAIDASARHEAHEGSWLSPRFSDLAAGEWFFQAVEVRADLALEVSTIRSLEVPETDDQPPAHEPPQRVCFDERPAYDGPALRVELAAVHYFASAPRRVVHIELDASNGTRFVHRATTTDEDCGESVWLMLEEPQRSLPALYEPQSESFALSTLEGAVRVMVARRTVDAKGRPHWEWQQAARFAGH